MVLVDGKEVLHKQIDNKRNANLPVAVVEDFFDISSFFRRANQAETF